MLLAGFLALALAASLAACGGSDSSGSDDEPEGKYEMEVVEASFPAKQALGQTSLMRIALRNTGDRAVPTAAVTISVAGEEGQTSSLPFGVHDRQPGLAQPDRPVWVLEEGYPQAAGTTTKRGGATSASDKSFDFGPLEPGKTVEGIWKLSAVRAGRFTVLFDVDAGLGGRARAETGNGVAPGGTFKVEITDVTPNVEVTDSGEVVEIDKGKGQSKGQGPGKKSSGG
jgi:hypothetical protein